MVYCISQTKSTLCSETVKKQQPKLSVGGNNSLDAFVFENLAITFFMQFALIQSVQPKVE